MSAPAGSATASSRPRARPSRESERSIEPPAAMPARRECRKCRGGRSLSILAQAPVQGGEEIRQLAAEDRRSPIRGVAEEGRLDPEEAQGGLGGAADGDPERSGSGGEKL